MGRIPLTNTSWTTYAYRERCPSCAAETSRSNYRVDALSGRAITVCDHCSQPLPLKGRKHGR